MKRFLRLLSLVSSLSLSPLASAAVPPSISYQGKLVIANTNYQGTAYFKFAIVNAPGNVTYWSNDGSSVGGQLPSTGIELPVVNGIFAVGLGDPQIVNMIPVPSSAFANADARLRVWFSTLANSGYQLLTPDQPIRSVGYAFVADSVPAGSIVTASLQNGAVTELKLANASVSTRTLADGSVTEPKLTNGAVSSRTIQTSAVDGSKIADGTITAADLSANSVATAQLQDGAVTESKLANAVVSTRTIQDNAVNGSKVLPGSITSAHLGPIWKLSSPNGSVDNAVNVDNNGNIGIGTTTPIVPLHITRGGAVFQYAVDSSTDHGLVLYRSRGTIVSPTISQTGDAVGVLSFRPFDGTSFRETARLIAIVDGSPVSGSSVPTALSFRTGSTGAEERMRITGNGKIGVGTGNPTALVDVVGSSESLLDLVMGGGAGNTPVLRIFGNTPKLPANIVFSVDRSGNLIANTLTPISDRNKKTNIVELNHRNSLVTVLKLPVYSWSFTNALSEIHEGPMAQDWFELTGLGSDDKHINPLDMAGKALSAIKGLHELVQEKDAKITALERQLAELKKQVTAMQETVAGLGRALPKSSLQQVASRQEIQR